MYKVCTLENGLKIASCYLPHSRSVAIGLWVGIGSRYESRQLNGTSHFVEHMLFKGTRKRSYRQIKESVEGLGGVLNAFTGEELTCYLAKVLKKHTMLAMDVLIDMVVNSRFQPSEINKERLVIFEEIKMYYDLPQHLAYDNLLRLLWPEHPLGRNIAGSFESLKKINKAQMLKFMKKYYCPDNMLLCTAGNITSDEVTNYLNKIFKKNRICFNSNASRKEFKKFEADNFSKKTVNFIKKDTKQTHIYLAVHGFKRNHSLRYALVLMHIIIGANMSSRLFNEVREKKGYAYEIASGIKSFNDTGAFLIHAGLVNEKADDACALILNELRKLCRNAVTKQELKRAKEYFKGQLLMALDDSLEHMGWLGERIMNNQKLKSPQEVIKAVDAVDSGKIIQTADLILKKKQFYLSVIGPLKKNKEKKITQLIGRRQR